MQCNDILKYNFIMTGKCHDIKVFYICIFSAYTSTHVKLPGVLTHVAPFWQPRSVPAYSLHSLTSTSQNAPCKIRSSMGQLKGNLLLTPHPRHPHMPPHIPSTPGDTGRRIRCTCPRTSLRSYTGSSCIRSVSAAKGKKCRCADISVSSVIVILWSLTCLKFNYLMKIPFANTWSHLL